MGKGTIKSNDFARGAAKKGQVTADQKKISTTSFACTSKTKSTKK